MPFGIAEAAVEVRATPPSAAKATRTIFDLTIITSFETPERIARSLVAKGNVSTQVLLKFRWGPLDNPGQTKIAPNDICCGEKSSTIDFYCKDSKRSDRRRGNQAGAATSLAGGAFVGNRLRR
jgi:hypothetical protein